VKIKKEILGSEKRQRCRVAMECYAKVKQKKENKLEMDENSGQNYFV
jgi:hypothetical protein